MREIKFRAWDGGKMIYQDADGYFDKVKHPKYPALQTLQLHSAMQVCEVMQFTGLYDKNGKEIYEGDIVSFKRFLDSVLYKGVVVYKLGNFLIEPQITIIDTFLYKHIDGIEVIGNIYENPELIK